MAQALRAAYAQSLMTAHLLEKFKVDNPEAEILPPHAMTIKEPSHAPQDGPQGNMPNGAGNKDEKICIVGAGAAGLAAAMDLHKAGFYNIEILEASAVAGGRMFTYDFPDIHDGCKHNYCDMGAMRIPQISRMKA